jgi:hypothetical protein
MNDLLTAQAVFTNLEARRRDLIAVGRDLADERCAAALAAYGGAGDEKARVRLEEIATALDAHARELTSLDCALKAAADNVARAQEAIAQSADDERRKRVGALLTAIEECAPGLDEMTGTASTSSAPTSQPRRFVSNPPLRVRLGGLLVDLVHELRALGLDAAWVPQRWDVSSQAEMPQAVNDMARSGSWRVAVDRIPWAERRTFKGILRGLARIIRAEIGEQTKRAA